VPLFHWTDDKGQLGITRDKHRVRTLDARLSEIQRTALYGMTPTHLLYLYHLTWFTDISEPLAGPIGVADAQTNKVAHMFRVTDESDLQPWTVFARSAPRSSREYVESKPDAMPAAWFVCMRPVGVTYQHPELGVVGS
jgi:hypothetical protein